MTAISDDIASQIDDAFDFRGHITVHFKDGATLEGYLFNRELSPMNGEAYIEVIPKDGDQRLRFAAATVKSIQMTGKDFAAPFVPPSKS